MKYWFDTEFIEAPQYLNLISIGIVSADGREFYAECRDVDWSRASQWVIDNVKPHIAPDADIMGYSRARLREAILEFVGEDDKPEFWADYAAYDWVALCWIFGTMMDLPKSWPMFVRDIQQMRHEDWGGIALPAMPEGERHNAVADARNCKARWEFLNSKAEAWGEGN